MNVHAHPQSPVRSLASRLALIALALGVLVPVTAARSADRVQRQRAGGFRAPAGSQRNGGCGAETEFPDPTSDLHLRSQVAGAQLGSAGGRVTGTSVALTPCDPTSAEQHSELAAALPGELWALALRARPQTPTFGRPPPL